MSDITQHIRTVQLAARGEDVRDAITDALESINAQAESASATAEGKQDALTFDSAPTSGSTNPVTSGGVAAALSLKADQAGTYTKAQVDQAISAAVTSVYRYRGSVNSYSDLPASGLSAGDTYNVAAADPSHGIRAGDNVAWTGSAWDVLAGDVDLSGYYTKAEVDAALSDVQDSLSFDDVPTEGSDNPVKSGGIFAAIQSADTTPDWEENDSSGKRFIRHRPFYKYDVYAAADPLFSGGSRECVFEAPAGGKPLVHYLRVSEPVDDVVEDGQVVAPGVDGYACTLESGERYRVTVGDRVYDQLTGYIGALSFSQDYSSITPAVSGICLNDANDEISIACSNLVSTDIIPPDSQNAVSCYTTQMVIVLKRDLSGAAYRQETRTVLIEKISEAVVKIPIEYIPTDEIASVFDTPGMSNSLINLQDTVSRNSSGITWLQNSIPELWDAVTSLESRITALGSAVTSLLSRVTALETENSGQADEIAVLENRISVLESRVTVLERYHSDSDLLVSMSGDDLEISGAAADVDEGILVIASPFVSVQDDLLTISSGVSASVSDGVLSVRGSVDESGALILSSSSVADGLLTL